MSLKQAYPTAIIGVRLVIARAYAPNTSRAEPLTVRSGYAKSIIYICKPFMTYKCHIDESVCLCHQTFSKTRVLSWSSVTSKKEAGVDW